MAAAPPAADASERVLFFFNRQKIYVSAFVFTPLVSLAINRNLEGTIIFYLFIFYLQTWF